MSEDVKEVRSAERGAMQVAKRFEELIAWQKARELTKAIYQTTRQNRFGRDFGLSGQIQRAAVSIMSNVAEGFERNRFGEFHQFLSVAKGSCAELRSHLYVAFDAGYLCQQDFDELLSQAEEVGRIVGGLRASLKDRTRVGQNSRHSTQHSARSTQH